ncbi:hypothetical protein CEXT_155291 [Caerostris extrusa]|uniref:Uncharacterized protein n=1 Tax=Caerostris extrusa TaxID=172846 RepID=A0AAV4QM14_CAEEX|nr:hypothetical protein CEXT_155291 [Caerostris extrusa]
MKNSILNKVILRAGVRIRRSNLPFKSKHPEEHLGKVEGRVFTFSPATNEREKAGRESRSWRPSHHKKNQILPQPLGP